MMESAPSRTGTIASDRGEIHDECGESGCVCYSDLVYFKTCATDGYETVVSVILQCFTVFV